MPSAAIKQDIEHKARKLAQISREETVVDMEQLARFFTIDDKIAIYGKTDLTGLSDEDFLKNILGE